MAASFSLNYPIRALPELQRHVKAKCFRGFEVYDKVELDWKLDREPARILALQDSVDVGRRASIIVENDAVK